MATRKSKLTDSCTLEEAQAHFDNYYGAYTPEGRFRAKKFDMQWQKKPEYTLIPGEPGSARYLNKKGPKTFDMQGVDWFEEGVEFQIEKDDPKKRKAKSLGIPKLSTKETYSAATSKLYSVRKNPGGDLEKKSLVHFRTRKPSKKKIQELKAKKPSKKQVLENAGSMDKYTTIHFNYDGNNYTLSKDGQYIKNINSQQESLIKTDIKNYLIKLSILMEKSSINQKYEGKKIIQINFVDDMGEQDMVYLDLETGDVWIPYEEHAAENGGNFLTWLETFNLHIDNIIDTTFYSSNISDITKKAMSPQISSETKSNSNASIVPIESSDMSYDENVSSASSGLEKYNPQKDRTVSAKNSGKDVLKDVFHSSVESHKEKEGDKFTVITTPLSRDKDSSSGSSTDPSQVSSTDSSSESLPDSTEKSASSSSLEIKDMPDSPIRRSVTTEVFTDQPSSESSSTRHVADADESNLLGGYFNNNNNNKLISYNQFVIEIGEKN